LSRPACTHGSSTPGEPDTPTPPITLTVAFASGREAVAVFASGDGAPTPQVGDYVEPLEGL